MKLLLTNDDGIDAPGLEALLNAARTLGDPVVVAPAGPQSGVSHAVTWHEGVRIEPRGDKRFAIHGTPADCTRLGLMTLVPDAKWVLSGINHGGNLGPTSTTPAPWPRCARPCCMAGPAWRYRTIARREWSTIGRGRPTGSPRSSPTCWRGRSSRGFSTM